MVFKTKGSAKPALNYALEKLLQCGSKKYPVRNLPAEMSMKSFSQLTPTQTTDDYLMFSFNSPILRDFSNLFTVYTSMIFDPLMRE
jgi:Zn-dependent M16 (insulinase) family peptidase